MLTRRALLQYAVPSLGAAILTGCGGGGSSTAASAKASQASGSTTATIESMAAPSGVSATSFNLTSTKMMAIKSTPATVPTYFTDSQTAGGVSGVSTKLGTPFADLSPEGCYATFAAVTSFNVAPSSETGYIVPPLTATLSDLLTSQWLACGGYCKLTAILTAQEYPTIVPPDAAAGAPAKPTLHMVVWLQTAPINIGVHSQIVVANVLPDAYLLLDPFYAYAMRIPYGTSAPDPSLTVIENAAALLQTPALTDNVMLLDSTLIAERKQVMAAMMSGAMGPQYIYHDALYGSEGWDTVLATL